MFIARPEGNRGIGRPKMRWRDSVDERGWFKTGIWEHRGIRRGFEKGRCPLCREKRFIHIRLLSKFSETRKGREQFFSRKRLINEEVAYNRDGCLLGCGAV
jgi:hypothetical protein